MSLSSLALPGVVMRPAAWAEAAVRTALAGFLGWVALGAEPIVLAMIGFGMAYHLYASARALSPLIAGSASLRLDRRGLVLRYFWREHAISWVQAREMSVQRADYVAGRRAGVLLRIGDAKGETGMLLIPDIFAPNPAALLAEMRAWQG